MVYLFLANGFEEMEALAPLDILRRANISVLSVGVGGIIIEGAHGVKVTADIGESEVDFSSMDMIILPGGGLGTENLGRSDTVKRAIAHCFENGKHMAAICAAPSVLGECGVLKGRRAVCFPGFEEQLEGAVIPSGEFVVTDGNITTAKSAGHALAFGIELVRVLKGDALSKEVSNGMMQV
ncbi:MAG: DJ-1/PfpI family protein [Oscillospiraceae bacterium]|nr:DJ-1/PfpI family protein [Oscillospiraceae bacterium]